MNKSAISSIATEVHELDVQSTKCAHLDDNWMKTLPLDSSDAVASEVTTQTVYGFREHDSDRLSFMFNSQQLLFVDFKNSYSMNDILNKMNFCHECKVLSL